MGNSATTIATNTRLNIPSLPQLVLGETSAGVPRKNRGVQNHPRAEETSFIRGEKQHKSFRRKLKGCSISCMGSRVGGTGTLNPSVYGLGSWLGPGSLPATSAPPSCCRLSPHLFLIYCLPLSDPCTVSDTTQSQRAQDGRSILVPQTRT